MKSIGMIASANLLATALGIVGSLVQAHFISPDDLGFVRKYSVVSGYAIFLSLGLFTIVQREYAFLLGRGEVERARQAVAIGQTWCLFTSLVVCGGLSVVSFVELFRGNWREASAWFIQIVSVWTILYGGYLVCTFRSGHEFERLSKGTFLSAVTGVLVLPLFCIWPFASLVLRSVSGSIISSGYLYMVRPVRVGWSLPRKEFFDLVKRGMRLFVGSYVRYHFWLTVEIWLMLKFAGDAGVGLLIFSTMIVTAVGQLSTAVNQVYMPRLANLYGRTGSLGDCLRLSMKPTVINLASAITFSIAALLTLPPILSLAFPKYVQAVPLLNILLIDTIIVALSLPLYMVSVLEDYATQLVSAFLGLTVFVGLAVFLHSNGLHEMAVVWGTITGRFVFVLVSIMSLAIRRERIRSAESLMSA